MACMVSDLKTSKRRRDDVPGHCAKCKRPVFESLVILDDAYAVWAGRCPHCQALNLLGPQGRGYHSGGMTLVLPTAEERDANGLPAECAVRD